MIRLFPSMPSIQGLALGWSALGCTALITLLSPVVSFGQQLLRAAPGVSAQLAKLEFSVVAGRVRAANHTTGGRLNFGARSLGREENLTADLSGPLPSIDYSIVTRKARIEITISDGERMRATCQPQGRSGITPMRFEQQPGMPISLVIDVGAATEREIQASTLWHLLIAEREVAAKHLLPVLAILRPDWPLLNQSAEIERQLYSAAPDMRRLDQARLAELVDQLASERFAERQAADRDLRALGGRVVPYLKGLRPERLDAEQQFRVRRIITALSGGSNEDVPIQVAQRLRHDPEIWLVLLSRDELTTRKAAARQLQAILGRTLDFDPSAESPVRTRQLSALRSELRLAANAN